MNYETLKDQLKQAEEHNKTGRSAEAETLAKSILAEIKNGIQDIESQAMIEQNTIHCSVLYLLTKIYWRRGNFQEALSTGQACLDLAEACAMIEIKSNTWNLLGVIHQDLSAYDEALECYQQALTGHKQFGNKSGEASALLNIGIVHQNLGSYDKTLEYFEQALAEYQRLGESGPIAIVTGNIGALYHALGIYDKALEFMEQALTAHRELGNKSVAARVRGNIGVVYKDLNANEKALECFEQALAEHEELGEKSGAAGDIVNIGIVYFNLGSYDKALEFFQKALVANKELGSKSTVALITGNIGGVYNKLGSFDKALESYEQALAVHKELGSKSLIAIVTRQIGELYANKNYKGYNASLSEEFLNKSIVIANEIDAKAFLIESYFSLADLYEKEENWENAYKQFKKHHDIEKEVQSEEAKKQAENMEYRRKIEESERDRQVKLARFQEQEKILLNILPAQIAERILDGEKQIADMHEHVSVFFSDIVGFTQLSQRISPDELLSMLNEIFSEFDRIARKHGLEKIKTIGDAYMAVAGVPIDCEDHAEKAAAFALDVIEYMKIYRQTSNSELQIRVGLHCGKAIAGVIGENKFAYDLWGDSVNTASRMESHGEAGRIHVSEDFRNALSESSYKFIERGEMEVKGKGKMKTYFLN